MASLGVISGFNMDSFISNSSLNEFFVWAWPQILGSPNFGWIDDHEYPIRELKITGVFDYQREDGWPSSGTITGLSYAEDSVTQFSISNTSVSINQLYEFADADDVSGLFKALLAGNDTISGSSGSETLHGFDGNDVMFGNSGNDTLYGDNGNDLMIGSAGDDHLQGGAGADLLSEGTVATGNDRYDGGADIDEVLYFRDGPGVTVNLTRTDAQNTGQGTDTLVSVENILATASNDNITGTDASNWIGVFAGSDIVSAGGGNDLISVGGGDKVVDGGAGNDGLEISDLGGNQGQASVTISLLLQGVAQDTGIGKFTLKSVENVSGSNSNDYLTGDDNINTLLGSGGNDKLFGGAGDDRMYGDGYFWIAAAGTFSVVPTVEGGSSTTVISGDDLLDGGAGIDVLDGGEGSDVYVIAAAADHPSAEIADTGVSGIDEVRFSATGTAQTLILRAGDTGIERIVIGTGTEAVAHTSGTLAHEVDGRLLGNGVSVLGNSGANRVLGTGFGDQLDGGAGSDRLLGYAGDDVLDGGKQLDQLLGGLGDDTYVVDDYGDATVELAGEGTDTVIASATVTLRDNVENLVQSGLLGINGTGNALDNVMEGNVATNRLFGLEGTDTLIGNEGNDQLNGGAGNDVLIGGAGNDYYFVDSAADTVTELAGEGRDTVRATASYTLSAEVEWLELQGSANLDGTGNGLANVLKGNAGDNGLSGLSGNDKLYGGAGSDRVDGGEGNDVLEGGSGRDEFTGGAGIDRFLFRDGDFGGATIATADVIHDFVHAQGDKIRLDAVDANSTLAGNQAFAFLGTGAFTNTAGQLRYEQSGGNTFVQGDLDGDGIADFVIQVDGTVNLVGGDFIL